MNENPGFGMLGGDWISVDCNSPPLVSPNLGITIQAVDHGSKLGAQQEDVDTTKGRDLVKTVGDRLLQDSGGKVADQISVHVHECASLEGRRSAKSDKQQQAT
jgi:hypothetical protein